MVGERGLDTPPLKGIDAPPVLTGKKAPYRDRLLLLWSLRYQHRFASGVVHGPPRRLYRFVTAISVSGSISQARSSGLSRSK
jgi:hypothetical protein